MRSESTDSWEQGERGGCVTHTSPALHTYHCISQALLPTQFIHHRPTYIQCGTTIIDKDRGGQAVLNERKWQERKELRGARWKRGTVQRARDEEQENPELQQSDGVHGNKTWSELLGCSEPQQGSGMGQQSNTWSDLLGDGQSERSAFTSTEELEKADNSDSSRQQ